MRSHNYSSLPDVANLLSKSCLCAEFKDSPIEHFTDNEKFDETIYDLDGFEEVFADHLLMEKRLRKTLYAGDFDCLDDLPDHPPIALTGLALELFSKAVPNYGLDILDMDYVSTATEAARISPCAMIIAMIYLERLQLKNSEYLETVSPPGLFVVTMLVASKFLFEDDEDIVTNRMWAEALKFDVKELNALEQSFLSEIDWKVYIDSSEYFRYLCKIEKVIAVKQSSLRDWLTYTDILVMMQDPNFQSFWTSSLKQVGKSVVLWTLGYVATALALYSTGIALQKLKVDDYHKQNYMVKNETTDLQNSVHSFVKTYYVPNRLSSETLLEKEFPLSSLVFEMSNGDPQVFPHNRSPFTCHSVIFKRKTSVFKVEITKSLPSNKLKIGSNDINSSSNKYNITYRSNNMAWLKLRQNRCISVLIR